MKLTAAAAPNVEKEPGSDAVAKAEVADSIEPHELVETGCPSVGHGQVMEPYRQPRLAIGLHRLGGLSEDPRAGRDEHQPSAMQRADSSRGS